MTKYVNIDPKLCYFYMFFELINTNPNTLLVVCRWNLFALIPYCIKLQHYKNYGITKF